MKTGAQDREHVSSDGVEVKDKELEAPSKVEEELLVH